MTEHLDAGGRAARSALLALIAQWRAAADACDRERPSSDTLVESARILDGCADELAEALDAAGLAAGDRPSLDPQYLNDVADRIIEMNGTCAHEWLVGFAKHLKQQLLAVGARPAPQEPDARIVGKPGTSWEVGFDEALPVSSPASAVSLPDADALAVVQRLRAEQRELNVHTHGFAYADCPKCARLREIGKVIGAAPVLPEPPRDQAGAWPSDWAKQLLKPDTEPPTFSLPAVLGTLPRYTQDEYRELTLNPGYGDWCKVADVARIVSALQHEIAQLKAAR